MKKNLIVIGVFCLTIFGACEPDRRTAQNEGYPEAEVTDASSPEDLNTEKGLQENSREFMKHAASANMMEVQLGQIAQEKATAKEVKDFGQMMVQDHSAANDKLKAIAQNKNVQLPDQMTQEHQENIEKLRKLSGKEFDKEYVNMMVEDHRKDVEKFEDMQDDIQDQELKQWTNNTLATLKKHKERIDQIENSIK